MDEGWREAQIETVADMILAKMIPVIEDDLLVGEARRMTRALARDIFIFLKAGGRI